MYWARTDVPSRVASLAPPHVCLACSPGSILAFCLNPAIGSQAGD